MQRHTLYVLTCFSCYVLRATCYVLRAHVPTCFSCDVRLPPSAFARSASAFAKAPADRRSFSGGWSARLAVALAEAVRRKVDFPSIVGPRAFRDIPVARLRIAEDTPPRAHGCVPVLVTPRRNSTEAISTMVNTTRSAPRALDRSNRAGMCRRTTRRGSRRDAASAATGLCRRPPRSTKTSGDTINDPDVITNGPHDRSRRPRRRAGDRRPSYRELAQRISRSRPRRLPRRPVVEERLDTGAIACPPTMRGRGTCSKLFRET